MRDGKQPSKAVAARRAGVAAAVALTTIVVYWPVLDHDFINYDDDQYVTQNPRVQEGLTLEGLRWAFTTGTSSNWHPLTWVSHMLDCEWSGLDAGGHHLTSLLIHALNAIVLLLLLERVTGNLWRGAIVAALFALHPLHVESVAWVAERKDVLSTLLWLLTIAAYVRYTRDRRLVRYLPVFVLLALGLMAKPMLVTAPFTLLLLDYWPLRRNRGLSWRRLTIEKLPLFALALGSGLITLAVQHAGGSMGSVARFPFTTRLANGFVSCAQYLYLMVWPKGLAVFYPHPEAGLSAWRVAGAVFLVGGLSVVAWLARRRCPWVWAGWLWYLVTLAPVVGLIQVGEQGMADRYTYVPLLGIFLAVAWSLPGRDRRPWGPGSRYAVVGAVVVALATLATLSRLQVRHWRNSETLFRHALEVTDRNHVAHLKLGLELMDRGETEPAIAELLEVLRIRPDPLAHNNLGIALDRLGRPEEAIAHYRWALRLDPDFSDAHYNLALHLAARNEIDEAMAHLRRVIEVRPDFAEAHYNYGTLLATAERWDEAARHLEKTIELSPGHAAAHNNLAWTLYFMGDYPGAWRQVQRAEAHGYAPPREMLRQLRERMPEPGAEAP